MGVHKRSNYEILFHRLNSELGNEPCSLEKVSDYQLLLQIDNLLKVLGCLPYTQQELADISLNMD